MSGTFPISLGTVDMVLRSHHTTFATRAHGQQRQARAGNGHYWSFHFSSPPLVTADWRTLYAFLIAQRGQYETFTIIPPQTATPRGAGGGTPLVVDAQVAGLRSITTDGWPNDTGVLKAGDVIKFGGHAKVYMVTADVTSSGTGTATLAIEPGLVSALVDNEAITYSNVPFTVALDADTLEMGISQAQHGQIDLSMSEVWNS